ncbi:hypothetical protein F5887DRAFT_971890 [Amanita rubescens]|nr:hypothetical protein F5887DRAFT_995628 [Amanita rubescens]KAF8343753.1 hypothetical protein F5887DRAFT_971890 [Amanita rubescens]
MMTASTLPAFTLVPTDTNVSSTVFHPNSPIIIISSSGYRTTKLWNSGTYHIENIFPYALERAWCIALRKDITKLPLTLTMVS